MEFLRALPSIRENVRQGGISLRQFLPHLPLSAYLTTRDAVIAAKAEAFSGDVHHDGSQNVSVIHTTAEATPPSAIPALSDAYADAPPFRPINRETIMLWVEGSTEPF